MLQIPSGGLKTIAETCLHSFGSMGNLISTQCLRTKKTKQNNISHAEQKTNRKVCLTIAHTSMSRLLTKTKLKLDMSKHLVN